MLTCQTKVESDDVKISADWWGGHPRMRTHPISTLSIRECGMVGPFDCIRAATVMGIERSSLRTRALLYVR